MSDVKITVHYRGSNGEALCAKPGKDRPSGSATVSLGKVTCWRCLEKVLGEPPLDIR